MSPRGGGVGDIHFVYPKQVRLTRGLTKQQKSSKCSSSARIGLKDEAEWKTEEQPK